MSKNKNKKVVEEIEEQITSSEDSSSSDGSDAPPSAPIQQTKSKAIKEKSVKQKKEFVMTEARKLAFEKARAKRAENLKLKQELKQKEVEHVTALKEKAKEKKEKKIKKLEKEIKEISSSESEEEVIIKKK